MPHQIISLEHTEEQKCCRRNSDRRQNQFEAGQSIAIDLRPIIFDLTLPDE